MFTRAALLFFFTLTLHFPVSGQRFLWNKNLSNAYACAGKLEFDACYRLAAVERQKMPDNLICDYVESQADFLKVFVGEESNDFNELKQHNAARLERLAQANHSPWASVLMAELHLQNAIAKIKFEEFLSAANDTRKAFKYLNQTKANYPGFKPALRGLGLLHAVIGSIPKNYTWITGVLGMEGSIEQGLNELKELYQLSLQQDELSYLSDDLVVMLTFLEINLNKEKKPESIASRFNQVVALNEKPLLLFAKSVYHFAYEENDSVINLLGNRKRSEEAYQLLYLDYMEGSARLHNLDPHAARCFARYIQRYKGKSYVAAAWQRLAWTKLLQGDEKAYRSCIAQSAKIQKEHLITDEDKQASKDATSQKLPNLPLLKSRLLFDGGYYNRALAELAGRDQKLFPELQDKLEFTYRLARIFDKQKKTAKALELYAETIRNGKNQTFYYAANATLLTGKIYEDQGEYVKAENYYKQVLEMRDHDYQNSIDQKAKAGINRLKDKKN